MNRPHYDRSKRRVVWEMDDDEAEWLAVELSPDGLSRDLFTAVDELRAHREELPRITIVLTEA